MIFNDLTQMLDLFVIGLTNFDENIEALDNFEGQVEKASDYIIAEREKGSHLGKRVSIKSKTLVNKHKEADVIDFKEEHIF